MEARDGASYYSANSIPSDKVTMPRQQFRFQLPKKACRMLGYIFLMLLSCCSLVFYNRRLLQVLVFLFQQRLLTTEWFDWIKSVKNFVHSSSSLRSHSPLSISVVHYGILVLSATFLRLLWVTKMTDKRRNYPDWSHYLKNELPVGISWALDIVCSIWSFILNITVLSLYMNTMTTSTSVVFILMFAIAFGLEQWVSCSSSGFGSCLA
ncbi:uncharacterized protein LOC141877892 [Acropora palmata]|uniref:uncharacterized protein LOC141877892 n=1 Tax=Acropora palmata TaxID=6131 RepID=UPI003DA17DE2